MGATDVLHIKLLWMKIQKNIGIIYLLDSGYKFKDMKSTYPLDFDHKGKKYEMDLSDDFGRKCIKILNQLIFWILASKFIKYEIDLSAVS